MFSFMLANWTTLRGATSVTSITQSESQWLDLKGFEDVVMWMEVREVTLSGATHVTITYQTSATKDDSLFSSIATAINLDTTIATVVITPVIKTVASIPLARWLRFQLNVVGTPTAAWDATFRIWVAANIGAVPRNVKRPTPPLRQGGKSCQGDCTKGGSAPMAPVPRPAVPSTMTPNSSRNFVQAPQQRLSRNIPIN